ncbi:hydrogenase maturation protease [Roseibium aggregatum]|uniref:Hydrogenase maturation protease n=1 Tax=Roseibium aggregatum TaxID=187304 RepID=A0A939J5L8_9HYPH|nr:hydrogenase maturation protease [Roseibium aggregatum]MBN9671864.1 hydrogenase maturation protease [Roseibium aggregatum]
MLLIGYGNPGRGDDGLGPAFSERLAGRSLPGLEVDTDYQLVAEHALAVAGHDVVVFADAEIGGAGAYSFREISTGRPEVLGSHSLVPETVLCLAETLYGAQPRAFVLGISGYDYGEVKEGLSTQAAANLDEAEAFFLAWLKTALAERETGHA